MNTFRLHPWMGFLALLAWLSLLIFWMGCRPAVTAFDTNLVVLDAHDAPPASGFALLVDDVSFSQNGTPLSWNAVSDTIHWSPNTGEVSISLENMGSLHWLICAPDPVTPGRMRTSVMSVGLQDTCRLDVQVPYQVLLRLRQMPPFDASCGAGGNVWTTNDVHIALINAPLPVLSHSNNQFGHAFEWIAKGLTTSSASQWVIHGANWANLNPVATTPTSSNLNVDVQRWTDAGYVDVPWHAADNIGWMTCEEYKQSKPATKKNAALELTNILGQEIQSQGLVNDELNPLLRKSE